MLPESQALTMPWLAGVVLALLQVRAADGKWQDTLDNLVGGSNYDAYSAPPEMGNPHPIEIDVGMSIKTMSYDITDGTLEMKYWMRMQWFDGRLNYSGNDAFGKQFDDTSPGRRWLTTPIFKGDNQVLWLPDVYVVNATDFHEGTYSQLGVGAMIYPWEWAVRQSKPRNVFLVRPATMKVYCKPILNFFPFDEQQCPLHLGSWAHSGDFVALRDGGDAFWQETIKLPSSNEYKLTGSPREERREVYWSATDVTAWSGLDVTLHLKRLPMYYLLNAIAPMVLIVAIAGFTFWIPLGADHSGSGERLSFSITCLLTNVAIQLFTCQNRPQLGSSTWLDRWIAICTICTFIPIIETVVVFWLENIFKNTENAEKEHLENMNTLPDFDTSHGVDEGAWRLSNGIWDVQWSDGMFGCFTVQDDKVQISVSDGKFADDAYLVKSKFPSFNGGVCWDDGHRISYYCKRSESQANGHHYWDNEPTGKTFSATRRSEVAQLVEYMRRRELQGGLRLMHKQVEILTWIHTTFPDWFPHVYLSPLSVDEVFRHSYAYFCGIMLVPQAWVLDISSMTDSFALIMLVLMITVLFVLQASLGVAWLYQTIKHLINTCRQKRRDREDSESDLSGAE